LLKCVEPAGDLTVTLLVVVGVLLETGSAAAEARRREGLELGSVVKDATAQDIDEAVQTLDVLNDISADLQAEVSQQGEES
jgi:hypothetical protein